MQILPVSAEKIGAAYRAERSEVSAVVLGGCAGRSASVAQAEPAAEIHWLKLCGKPASKCG